MLGIDLQKDSQILEAAYNDSQGITAQFNFNILEHLNWRFDGNFNLSEFEYKSFYNEEKSQMEMYLVSQKDQWVNLEGLDLRVKFATGESMLTEISRKFNLKQMEEYLENQGLKTVKIWTDSQTWFGLILCQFKA